MVGTVLVMELGGASIPDGCNGGRGGGGPVLEDKIQKTSYNCCVEYVNTNNNK